MLIYPLVADVPEVAVLIGVIMLFNRVPLLIRSMPLVKIRGNDPKGMTTEEIAIKKEGAGV